MQLALAQLNPTVGAIAANRDRILATIQAATAQQAELLLLPELALCGYPPEDLLYQEELLAQMEGAVAEIAAATPPELTVILGTVERRDGRLYNSAAVIQHRSVRYYRKQQLPNYGVFDERRYFTAGSEPLLLHQSGYTFGILICEDVWFAETVAATVAAGAEWLLVLNASPFHATKSHQRLAWLQQQAHHHRVGILYLNLVGGQDELVFDGDSLIVNHDGELVQRGVLFQEQLIFTTLHQAVAGGIVPQPLPPPVEKLESIRQAIGCGLRDYLAKNRIRGVVLGLSGGIDSALTLALAVEALGAERVIALSMPSRYSAAMSREDAVEQCQRLGVTLHTLPIEAPFNAFLELLAAPLAGYAADVTEENIQARCRGVLVMAMANKLGYLALTTGNKSEVAVGYATLYGDMAGGFSLLKDLLKTEVYRLSHYLNSRSSPPVIPQRVIDRPPSAELAPNQRDSDSLPDYATLDAIIRLAVEEEQSVAAMIAQGFEAETVKRVVRLIQQSEHKRRQAAPGVKLTPKAFGRDRRYPITHHYRSSV